MNKPRQAHRLRMRGLWRSRQAWKKFQLRPRVRGLWRVRQGWEETRLNIRERGLARVRQAWREARLGLQVRGIWRLQHCWRELRLRWQIQFGVPLTPRGMLRAGLLGVGALAPVFTTKIGAFLVGAAAAGRTAARGAMVSDGRATHDSIRLLMLCAHEPKMDPRIGWEAQAAARGFEVTVLGFNREDGSEPEIEQTGGYRIVRLRRTDLSPASYFWQLKDIVPLWVRSAAATTAVLLYPGVGSLEIAGRVAFFAFRLTGLRGHPRGAGGVATGVSRFWSQERVDFVLGNLRMQFAPATEMFYRHIAAMPAKPHVVHCNDLDTLLAGVLAKRHFGCGVVYDAHEFWPVMDAACTWIDRIFFSALERYLIRRIDAAVTVNPLLAELMRDTYRLPRVYSVPNVEPWVENRPRLPARSPMAKLAGGRVKFLFQGRFTKARGIEEIIAAWPQVDGGKAALFLRGPDNPWRQAAIELADRLRVLDRSVYFLDAVREAELVAAATEADVGVIPYLPIAINERLACPNKLSQYLHAGLMILTNDLPYVRSVVADAHAGSWYDSAEPSTFAAAVDRIAADRELVETCRRNALAFAKTNFNWQRHGGVFLNLYAAASGAALRSHCWATAGVSGVQTFGRTLPRPAGSGG
jgi:glycosyltransferase involved in cell wall biosynthesis